jgi:protein-S-isoprenylcysteine O-methyltransferase Ste14
MATAVHNLHTNRIAWSRVFIFLVLCYVLLFNPPDFIPQTIRDLGEILGFVFLAAATLGRIWCLTYIAGIKNEILVTEGPYSVVRNPLYVFSFVGAVGFGLTVENPLLALLLALVFSFYYPYVVRGEERFLESIHPEKFREYSAVTPRWIPDFSLFREPAAVTISPMRIRKGMLDAMWFLWAVFLWEVTEQVREAGLVHALLERLR